MTDQPNYECLPQRAPRQKRKRVQVTTTKVENASDGGNVTAAPNKKNNTAVEAAEAGGAPLVEPVVEDKSNGVKENAEKEDKEPSEAVSEQAEYRACAEPGQKFECKFNLQRKCESAGQ
jgi:hypothetical protein